MSDPITLIMSYYRNPGMLQVHYKIIADLPPEIRGQLYLVLVDDGSPEDLAAKPPEQDLGICGFQLYRMLVDIRWNQDAARNLGARFAETEWILLTDIDHAVPQETWRLLLNQDWDRDLVYTFTRKMMPTLEVYKDHVNSWLMSKRLYDLVGGYDERFSGIYGTDGDFRKRLNEVAGIKRLETPLVLYPRSVIPDASTTNYLRKQPEDDAGKRRVKASRALEKDPRPKRYLFPYERVV
jgi:glycosyltransferase involved in cell wall biosynthesis